MSGGAFERSADGGQTWQREIDSLSLTEAEVTYYKRSRDPLETDNWRQPQDLFIDRVTGNVVVALGQAGVMVRTPDGQWRHVSVGPYSYEALDSAKIGSLLSGESALTLAVPLMILGTSFSLAMGRRWWHFILGLSTWLTWSLLILLSPAIDSVLYDSASNTFVSLLYLPMAIALPWGINSMFRLSLIAWHALLIVGLCATAGAVLFYLPYLLWAWAKIPNYDTARAYALLLVVAVSVLSSYLLQRWLDHIDLDKRHGDPIA